eukprot:TRINITY_DN1505_c1_g1_i1.p1 TRINITY_DN1505_c1_g1~~TRINITY_DN1505_c1_g1_i1.p1  ORF type:complete len:328 (+),score=130.21 TRINITY_DN1505_c1_g1_i1:62-985(+)
MADRQAPAERQRYVLTTDSSADFDIEQPPVSELDYAAMSLLISEARRLDHAKARKAKSAGRRAPSPRTTDRRWRELRSEVLSSLVEDRTPEVTRAQFAGRFPFLGLIPQEGIDVCRRRQQAVIQRLQRDGRLFLPTEDAVSCPDDRFAADQEPPQPEPELSPAALLQTCSAATEAALLQTCSAATEAAQTLAAEEPEADPWASEVDVNSAMTAIAAAVTAASAANKPRMPELPHPSFRSDSTASSHPLLLRTEEPDCSSSSWDPVQAGGCWLARLMEEVGAGGFWSDHGGKLVESEALPLSGMWSEQ